MSLGVIGLLLLSCFVPDAQLLKQRAPLNVTASSGISIELKCKVRFHDCGNFYSIKWYKGDGLDSQRVYVYLHRGQPKAENSWKGRANHSYDAKKHLMKVHLANVRLEDEGKYRCEIDYEFSGRWFKEACTPPQETYLQVFGKPTFIRVSMANGTEIISKNDEPNTVIGPFTESTMLILRCEAGGGRPIPEVKLILTLCKA